MKSGNTLINYYWDLFLKTVMIVNFQTVILLLYEKVAPYGRHLNKLLLGPIFKNSYDSKFSNSNIIIV